MKKEISRRELYLAGEPLGCGVTRAKPGGRIMGDGGESSSSNTNHNTTLQTDKRTVADAQASVNSLDLYRSEGNTISITDGGALARVVDFARDFATGQQENAKAQNTELLNAAISIMKGQQEANKLNSDLALQATKLNAGLAESLSTGIASAYENSSAESSGNKTVLIVGAVMIGAFLIYKAR